jgi:septum formation protein
MQDSGFIHRNRVFEVFRHSSIIMNHALGFSTIGPNLGYLIFDPESCILVILNLASCILALISCIPISRMLLHSTCILYPALYLISCLQHLAKTPMSTLTSSLLKHFPNIILASASPRRAELLRQIGLDFQIRPSHIDEPEITQSPETAVQELALMKAHAVANELDSGLVIGADTVVVIDGQPLGKPENDQHAIDMLTQLSGNWHEVITGVALIGGRRTSTPQEVVWAEKTAVYFRKLRRAEILDYVRSGETADKAGAYGIQERAGAFVERIEGCYFNVVGLPLASLVERLWRLVQTNQDSGFKIQDAGYKMQSSEKASE